VSLRVLDLFSGIGAYALGLERAGMSIAAFCEIEEYPRRVLRRHWPDVPIYDDVRTLDAATLRRDGIAVDVVCGGWPCQDFSPAGTGAGLDGARSGLWVEIARILGDVRPRWAVLENSSNLLGINGGADFGRVLGDMAALGYDVEWHCLPAAAFDAPHIRDRLWIVAHRRAAVSDAARDAEPGQSQASGAKRQRAGARGEPTRAGSDADADVNRGESRAWALCEAQERRQSFDGCAYADADGAGLEVRQGFGGDAHEAHQRRVQKAERDRGAPGNPSSHPHGHAAFGASIARRERHTWQSEPDVVRVVHGAPNRVERIRALGNLNPPIVPELIGRAILQAEGLSAHRVNLPYPAPR
jgi:DNA (cytosine-5)-methyltransferase 1